MQAPAGGSRLLIKKPVGPCLFVTPWNFPLAMGTRKIGPAVAAGCTMVVKPAAQTRSMLALAAVLAEAGLPDGVLNVVPTRHAAEVNETLQADDRLRKVSFTGSTGIGRVLIRQSAEQLQRVSMELGGNAPFLVFEDADVDAAVDGAMVAKMRNMGEACTAANRFLVQASVAQEFADKLAKRMGALTLGRGQDEGVDVGPLIDEKAVETVGQLVTDAVEAGATALVGGKAPDGPGYFYPPTVLLDVPADSAINVEEIFGPVAPITTFETEEEAITGPTRPSTACRRTSTPATSGGRCGWRRRWSSGWSASTRAWCRTRPRRSAGEGQRLRARGRVRGHRGIPRDDVRRAADALVAGRRGGSRGALRRPGGAVRRLRDRGARFVPLLRGVGLRRRRRPQVLACSPRCPRASGSPTSCSPRRAARRPGARPVTPSGPRCSPTTGSIRATILRRSTQTARSSASPPSPRRSPRSPTASRSRCSRSARAPAGPLPRPLRLRWRTARAGALGPGQPRWPACEVSQADAPLPDHAPAVAWRGSIDLNPLDVTDEDAAELADHPCLARARRTARAPRAGDRDRPVRPRSSCGVTCSTSSRPWSSARPRPDRSWSSTR